MTRTNTSGFQRLFRIVLLALGLVCASGLTTFIAIDDAQAATPAERKKAGEHYNRGKEMFEEGNHAGALVEFERAYKLAPNWRVLYNIGQVKYQLQDYPGAMAALEQYLREGNTEIPADRRGQVLSDVERLRSRISYVKITVNEDGATVSVDDREVGISPLAKAIAVSAGRRKITASAPGAAPETKFVDLAGGDSGNVSLLIRRQVVPTPTPTPTPTPKNGDDDGNAGPYAGWGITAGFGITALVLGLLALDAAGDLDDAKGTETTKADLESDRKKVFGLSVATDVMLGATVIAAAVAVYLTVDAATADDKTGEPSNELGVRVTPTGFALEGTF